jgi:hypothetical protein
MQQVIFRPKIRSKNYLENLGIWVFPSLLHLIQAFFETYTKGTTDWEHIQLLLAATGYGSLNEIPRSELAQVKETVARMQPVWEADEDAEKCTYLLLAAILKKDILVYIDDRVIENIEHKITLQPDSIVAFINRLKITQINFTTI